MSYQFTRTGSLAMVAGFLLAACAGRSASVAPTAIPAAAPTAATQPAHTGRRHPSAGANQRSPATARHPGD